jgi:RimJ/RimL family protein N-acetyltransferase
MDYELRSERLVLKPVTEADTKAIFAITHENYELTKNMSWDPPKKIEETRAFIQITQNNFPLKTIAWGIHHQDSFIGIISLENITNSENTLIVDKATLGYWLADNYQGKGFMTEAGHAVLQFAFMELKLHKVDVGHFSKNIASGRVIEKLGFKYIGEQKKHYFKNGEWHDHKVYELLAEDHLK